MIDLKGVIRNREIFFATPEEIKVAQGKQGVTDYKRITIIRVGKGIETYSCILTFNKLVIPKEVKIVFRKNMYLDAKILLIT